MGERPTFEQISPYLLIRAANTHISQSRVAAIGEHHPYTEVYGQKVHHPEDSTRDTVNNLIWTIAKPGDILLIERHPYGEVADPATLQDLEFDVPEWLTVLGWDNIALRRRAQGLLDTARIIYENSQKLPRDRREYDLYEAQDIHLEGIRIALERNTSLQQAIKEIEPLVPEGNKLIVVVGERHWEDCGSVDVTAWLERNYNFCVLYAQQMAA